MGFLLLAAVLMVLAGLMMVLGFWPVALILGGLALIAWITRQ